MCFHLFRFCQPWLEPAHGSVPLPPAQHFSPAFPARGRLRGSREYRAPTNRSNGIQQNIIWKGKGNYCTDATVFLSSYDISYPYKLFKLSTIKFILFFIIFIICQLLMQVIDPFISVAAGQHAWPRGSRHDGEPRREW